MFTHFTPADLVAILNIPRLQTLPNSFKILREYRLSVELAHAVKTLPVERLASLAGAATALVESLPGAPSRAPLRDPWHRDPGMSPSFVVDLFNAVGRVNEELAVRAADHVLAWPKTYGLDKVVVPGTRQLIESVMIRDKTTVQRLRIACRDRLRARVAEPLEAPGDWSRANDLACRHRRLRRHLKLGGHRFIVRY